MFKRTQKHYLYLSREETSLILQSLVQWKNKLLREGRYTDCIDEVIVKLVNAPAKRVKT